MADIVDQIFGTVTEEEKVAEDTNIQLMQLVEKDVTGSFSAAVRLVARLEKYMKEEQAKYGCALTAAEKAAEEKDTWVS